jgi:type VI secretion system secreted protein Hcp
MAVDAFIWFLKYDSIDGESTERGHEKEIEVMSFHWGVSQSGSLAFGGGGGAGKAQFQDLHYSSNTSKASPQLMLACASGRHLKYATLSGRKAGGEGTPADFLHVKIEDVLVSSYNNAGDRNSGPGDAVSLNYARIAFSFTGSDGKVVSEGWDVKANKAV